LKSDGPPGRNYEEVNRMSDEREKLLGASEEPEVEAHKALKANEEKASDEESDTPDVEAHKVLKKVNI
jgi:hypothetical protein